MKSMFSRVLLTWGLAALIGAAGSPALAATGVRVVLAPATGNVQLGEQFDLEVTIPDSSAEFNAFELEVVFDDSLLTLVSNQEGPVMTGACGSRFHVFDETDGTFTVTDGLLCSGAKVSGPGVIYVLRFQANVDDTLTSVVLQAAGFSDAGINVTPVEREHAQVVIGNVIGVPDGDGAPRARLHAPFPNPFQRAVNLGFTALESGDARLEVYSVSGRLMKRLMNREVVSGQTYPMTWDGSDEQGRPVPPGIYFVRLTTGTRAYTQRMVRIP